MELKLNISLNEKLSLRDPEASDLGRRIVKNGANLINQLGFEGGQGAAVQHFDTGARRHADGLGRRRVGRGAGHAQGGPAILALQNQALPGVDAVRIADVVEVNAPQLRPAPGAFEENAGNGPQRVARLHGVVVRGVGRQFTQGNAGLRHLLRRGLLAGRHDQVLGVGGG